MPSVLERVDALPDVPPSPPSSPLPLSLLTPFPPSLLLPPLFLSPSLSPSPPPFPFFPFSSFSLFPSSPLPSFPSFSLLSSPSPPCFLSLPIPLSFPSSPPLSPLSLLDLLSHPYLPFSSSLPSHTSHISVVGSGFGGSVSAMRLTEKGYRVGVLEAGKRFGPADFPKTTWSARRYLWAPLRALLRHHAHDGVLATRSCCRARAWAAAASCTRTRCWCRRRGRFGTPGGWPRRPTGRPRWRRTTRRPSACSGP